MSNFSGRRVRFTLSTASVTVNCCMLYSRYSRSILIFMLILVTRKRKENVEKVPVPASGTATVPRGPDMELATLRSFHRGTILQQNNFIYGLGEVTPDEELAGLTRVGREDIRLTNFLGSGAFGEVFEGTAFNLPNRQAVEKVAVKVRTTFHYVNFENSLDNYKYVIKSSRDFYIYGTYLRALAFS